MSHSRVCFCPGCNRSREWTHRVETGNVVELKKLIDEMRGLICDLEADIDWLRTKEFRTKQVQEALKGLTEIKNSVILKT